MMRKKRSQFVGWHVKMMVVDDIWECIISKFVQEPDGNNYYEIVFQDETTILLNAQDISWIEKTKRLMQAPQKRIVPIIRKHATLRLVK
jgi:hypothetical protein